MGINELFDELARVIDPFAEELAEQKLMKKQQIGRGPKVRAEKTEKKDVREEEIYPNFPKTG